MILLRRSAVLLALIALAFLAWGCSDSTGPEPDTPAGDLDPSDGRITLKTLETTDPEGRPVRLALEAGDMHAADGMVSFDVVVRNLSDVEVTAPLIVWFGEFTPTEVMVMNPDIVMPGLPGEPMVVGYVYDELLGETGILMPGEATEPKHWEFADTEMVSFTFDAWIEAGFGPPPAVLGGSCFIDVNSDGVRQPDEPPADGILIHVSPSDPMETVLVSGPDGRFHMPVFEPGLYTLTADFPPTMPPWEPYVTTPNPVYVTLVVGPDGVLQGFDDVEFGIWMPTAHPIPMVEFSDLPADSLHVDYWSLIGASVDERGLLALEMGYSGCQPEHEFGVWVVGGFMESMPPQLNLLPVHYTVEECDAAFQGVYQFGLMHVMMEAMDVYGPGPLLLNILGYDGEVAATVEVFGGLD